MRQGQHKQRSRGRGRKVHNPSNRSYDSNGPDVKIRGTAAHIAEKYSTLARDSQVSGDRVASENYLQHAEHYNRIVAAGQAHLQQQQLQQQQVQQPVSPPVTNGQDGTEVGEVERTEAASEEISGEAAETPDTEKDAPKTRTGNLRQRRRRSASGRNDSAARSQSVAADNTEAPAPKPEEAQSSSEAVPEMDQTAAE